LKKILVPFSYLLHPIFIPLFGALFYLYEADNYLETLQKFLLLSQIVLVTIFIPFTLLYFLKAMGKVDSIMVSDTSQRKIPMLVQIVLMALLLSKSVTLTVLPELFFFYLGGILSALLAFVFLFLKIKISIHTLGISSLTMFVIAISIHDNTNLISIVALLMICNGLVASSRMVMNAHTTKELLLGFALGIFPQLALLRFWL
jgi:hypothetical protein